MEEPSKGNFVFFLRKYNQPIQVPTEKNMNFRMQKVKTLQNKEYKIKKTIQNVYRPHDQPTYKSKSCMQKQ